MKDQLFILRPGFFKESEGPFYCGDSVSVEGLLGFYPQLRHAVDVVYVDAARPRVPIVKLIGEDNQSAPVLVLSPESGPACDGVDIRVSGEMRFIDSPDHIRRYLSSKYGVAHQA
ncbi:hypothetical protein PTE30175_03088 [Pandoraea terrae]|uniref:DUF3088 domain-containing protein n=1 Tax=Pandoraea terrae TaxID=1537710 RepID=A0A5E4WF05_9BURK|nr:DUF3088 domain-containing protein [Pandoraea terrae]VVE21615.1 hypothetical protein PTE30175_03088 [Pandoraea terrae]